MRNVRHILGVIWSCSAIAGSICADEASRDPAPQDELPVISFGAHTQVVSEADGVVEVPVYMQSSSTQAVTVACTTADQTAAAGQDYAGGMRSVVWQPGESGEKTVAVELTNDALSTGDRLFRLTLGPVSNGVIAVPAQLVVLIRDDELSAPEIENARGATQVAMRSAVLQGELLAGAPSPAVTVYWGTRDGGMLTSSWSRSAVLPSVGVGRFSYGVSNLLPNTTYFYRCKAARLGGDVWAPTSSTFTTTSGPMGDLLARAVAQIATNLLHPTPVVYPRDEAMASGRAGDPHAGALLTGPARELVPAALWDAGSSVTSRWISLAGTNPAGPRGAYVILNASGLLDANRVGGSPRVWSTNVAELDLTTLPDVADTTLFVTDRALQGPYASIDALRANRGAAAPVSNLLTYTRDPGRDWMFFSLPVEGLLATQWWTMSSNYLFSIDLRRPPPTLGTTNASRYLGVKFNVNSFFDAAYSNTIQNAGRSVNAYLTSPTFMARYWRPLRDLIALALPGIPFDRAGDIAWNVVNYLDPDDIPHGSDTVPWTHSEGVEAVPLINEIVVKQIDIPRSGTNAWGPTYVVHTELWYPFTPGKVTPDDNYFVQVMLFNGKENSLSEMAVSNSVYLNTNYSFTAPVLDMEFGTTNEFKVYATTNIFFVDAGTNRYADLGAPKVLYYLARVYKVVNGAIIPVDEAMGYRPNEANPAGRELLQLNRPWAYGVNDPRSNGQLKYWFLVPQGPFGQWSGGADYDWRQHTLGTTNLNRVNKPVLGYRPLCEPYAGKGQGVPIYHRNGPMTNIGELGHLYQSGMSDEEPNPDYWSWRTLSIMRANEGALLLDMLTTRAGNGAEQGLICMNSRQTNTWRAALGNLRIGEAGAAGAEPYLIPTNKIDALIAQLVAKATASNTLSFYDLFTTADSEAGGGGALAEAFRDCAPPARQNDYYKEAAFRSLCELVSFRQNVFLIVLARQEFCDDGTSVAFEERSVATLARDAYTGVSELIVLTNYFAAATPCPTDVHYVSPDGANQWPYTNWTEAAWQIQDAVQAAGRGDTVLVQDATYALTSQVVVAKGVTLQASGDGGGVTLVGDGTNRCLFLGHVDAVVDGFTLTGGVATNGGGVYIDGGGTLRNCLIRGNRAYSTGGGVYVHAGGALQHCTVVGNRAEEPGAAGISGWDGGVLENTIVYTNQVCEWSTAGASVTWRNCRTYPLPDGPSNSASDPGMLAPPTDVHLTFASSSIDAARDLSPPVLRDLEHRRRSLDGDFDGIGAPDIGAFEYDPEVADSDGDGMPDAWEYAHQLGPNNGADADAHGDADGMNNSDEFIADTDPTNAASVFQIRDATQAASSNLISFPSSTQRVYVLQATTNFPDGAWTDVPGAGPVPGNGGTRTLADGETSPARYYRVDVSLP
ncbi:MAG: hypothetical protein K8T26_19185 [Lentisphaerae bacterium]|nr:hypothetical protein [Lentisphaerota bacterium]